MLPSIVDFAEQGEEIGVTGVNQVGSSSGAVLDLLQTFRARAMGLGLLDLSVNQPGLVYDALINSLEMICSLDGRIGNRQMAHTGPGRRNRVPTDDICSLQARGNGGGTDR